MMTKKTKGSGPFRLIVKSDFKLDMTLLNANELHRDGFLHWLVVTIVFVFP